VRAGPCAWIWCAWHLTAGGCAVVVHQDLRIAGTGGSEEDAVALGNDGHHLEEVAAGGARARVSGDACPEHLLPWKAVGGYARYLSDVRLKGVSEPTTHDSAERALVTRNKSSTQHDTCKHGPRIRVSP
jgi:hypothetical protein